MFSFWRLGEPTWLLPAPVTRSTWSGRWEQTVWLTTLLDLWRSCLEHWAGSEFSVYCALYVSITCSLLFPRKEIPCQKNGKHIVPHCHTWISLRYVVISSQDWSVDSSFCVLRGASDSADRIWEGSRGLLWADFTFCCHTSRETRAGTENGKCCGVSVMIWGGRSPEGSTNLSRGTRMRSSVLTSDHVLVPWPNPCDPRRRHWWRRLALLLSRPTSNSSAFMSCCHLGCLPISIVWKTVPKSCICSDLSPALCCAVTKSMWPIWRLVLFNLLPPFPLKIWPGPG